MKSRTTAITPDHMAMVSSALASPIVWSLLIELDWVPAEQFAFQLPHTWGCDGMLI